MASIRSSSLFEAPRDPVLSGATEWLAATMLGSVATGLCIVAIAVIGLMMLSGRLPLRHGGRVLLGCFILFAAPVLASALRDLANSDEAVPIAPQVSSTQLPPRPLQPSSTYDPYAGASVRQN